jgi:formate dehydrogenase subunit gamma
MAIDALAGGRTASVEDRVARHAAVDRIFHWVVAASVLALLATGLLPVVGIEFPWVMIHWISGVVLTVAVLFHIVRASFWQRLRCVWIRAKDFRELSGTALPGKYSLAQKLMHHAMTLVVLTAVVTGVLMMARIDTPFWERDPYLLSASTWGIVYVLHGAASLLTLTLVMIHVYFGLLPEKRLYLRAMTRGWITRDELMTYHDPQRWRARQKS